VSAWWVSVVALSAFGSIMVALAAVRAHREIEPTIRAFDEFRSALRPIVAEVSTEASATRVRLEQLTRPGATPPQG
jgi:hypothetical protein